MARVRKDAPEGDDTAKSTLEFALVGEGIHPGDVDARELASVLTSTVSLLDAVAKDAGVDPASFRLVSVRNGSAAYALQSSSPTAPRVLRSTERLVKTRGKEAAPSVRMALGRLFTSASIGAIRITAAPAKSTKKPEQILLARPLEVVASVLELADEVHGRVVGVHAGNADHRTVQVRLSEGGTHEFDATPEVAAECARLFNQPVRARVTYRSTKDGVKEDALESVQLWSESGFLGVMHDIRDDLAKEGLEIDAAAWLAEDAAERG